METLMYLLCTCHGILWYRFIPNTTFIAQHVPNSIKLINSRNIYRVILLSFFIISLIFPFMCTTRITTTIRIIFIVFFFPILFIIRKKILVLFFLVAINPMVCSTVTLIFIPLASIDSIPYYWSTQCFVEVVCFLYYDLN